MTPSTTSSTLPRDPARRIEHAVQLQWLPLGSLQTSPTSQRELNQGWVEELTANLDLDKLGTFTVSRRGQIDRLVDGQHRAAALKAYGFDPADTVQCRVYAGLSQAEEAELFLSLNNTLSVDAFSKFSVGVHAGREIEAGVDRAVRSAGLVISRNRVAGAVRAVGTLKRIYSSDGPEVLGRTLAVVRDAYGDTGMRAAVLAGIGQLVSRYRHDLDDAHLTTRLGAVRGGVNGLLGPAEALRRSTGLPKPHCVAAAAVDVYNTGRRNRRLPSWWHDLGPEAR